MIEEATTVQNVKDLQAEGRQWLESILGHQPREDQQILITVTTPGEKSDAARRQAIQTWERIVQKVQQNLKRGDISDDDYDVAVDEAMESIRPRGK